MIFLPSTFNTPRPSGVGDDTTGRRQAPCMELGGHVGGTGEGLQVTRCMMESVYRSPWSSSIATGVLVGYQGPDPPARLRGPEAKQMSHVCMTPAPRHSPRLFGAVDGTDGCEGVGRSTTPHPSPAGYRWCIVVRTYVGRRLQSSVF